MKIGKIIYELRKENNLTQAQLGNDLNVTYQAVSKWENGTSSPDFETIVKISKLFNVSLDYFTNDEKEEKEDNVEYIKEVEYVVEKTHDKKSFLLPILVLIYFLVAIICIEIVYVNNLFITIPLILLCYFPVCFCYYITFDDEIISLYDKSLEIVFIFTNITNKIGSIFILINPIALLLGVLFHIVYILYVIIYSGVKVITGGNYGK
ncbi:MAG: helix-turn-helix transcriptional regulator [bacterium]